MNDQNLPGGVELVQSAAPTTDQPHQEPHDLVDVEVIRHPVGADGTMRFRFTFNVAIDPEAIRRSNFGLGAAFYAAMNRAFESEEKRLRNEDGKLRVAFGTSRADGMPLPAIWVNPDAALLANRPILLSTCPSCGTKPFTPFMRGMVARGKRSWRTLWLPIGRPRPHCAVICDACKEIVGWEAPDHIEFNVSSEAL